MLVCSSRVRPRSSRPTRLPISCSPPHPSSPAGATPLHLPLLPLPLQQLLRRLFQRGCHRCDVRLGQVRGGAHVQAGGRLPVVHVRVEGHAHKEAGLQAAGVGRRARVNAGFVRVKWETICTTLNARDMGRSTRTGKPGTSTLIRRLRLHLCTRRLASILLGLAPIPLHTP